MRWIRSRLTPEGDECKQDFAKMIKVLSQTVPQVAKDNDIALEEYRIHVISLKQIQEMKQNIEKQIASQDQAIIAKIPKANIRLFNEIIDLYLAVHTNLKQLTLLSYYLDKNNEDKTFLK